MSGASCVAGTNLTPHQLRNFISTTHQGPGVHALCGVSGNFPGHFNRAEGDLPSHPGVHTRDATFWQLPGEESVADSHGFTVNMGAHVLLFAFFFSAPCTQNPVIIHVPFQHSLSFVLIFTTAD